MASSELNQLLYKYERGECTPQELERLHIFFQSFVNYHDVWADVDNENKEKIKHRIFESIERDIFNNETTIKQSKSKFRILQIAASFILLIGIGLYFNYANYSPNEEKEYLVSKTSKGEKLTVNLPDGSKVFLNATSSLAYSSDFSNNRKVKLRGEAFFEVAKDSLHPFIIESRDVTTTVLGTSFNISAYKSSPEIKVTVVTGKVSVAANAHEVFLEKGEQAICEHASMNISEKEVDVQEYVSWKRGILVFNESTLSEVFAQLERWYGVKINYSAITQSCNLRLSFDNLSLEDVLEQLKYLTGIDYEFKTKDEINIMGTGCLDN